MTQSTPLNRELKEIVRETLFEYGSTNKSVNLGEAKNIILKAFDQSLKAFADEVEREAKHYVTNVNQSDGYEVTEYAIPVSALKDTLNKWISEKD